MELLSDLIVRCNTCGHISRITKNDIDFDSWVETHGENGMGDEIVYSHHGGFSCPNCQRDIEIKLIGSEYPAGAYNYDSCDVVGGSFEEVPCMGIIYDEDDYYNDEALDEYDRIAQLIHKIADDRELIYEITPREFEEIIERLFIEEGFETRLTKATRDGGKDIVATKYEMGKPIVFYIECKRYGRKNRVDVRIVRSSLGVQTADRINKTILVTTGHVTSDARRFIEEQNVLLDVLDIQDINNLIVKSSNRAKRCMLD